MSDTVSNQAELARRCGVSTRTTRRWTKDGTLPGGAAGPWNPAAVAQWAAARRSRGARRGEPALEVRVGVGPAPADAAPGDGAAGVPAGRGDDFDAMTSGEVDEAARRAAARYRAAKASREELLLAQLRGELIERGAVEKLLVERAMFLRKTLLALGRRLAPLVVGLDTRSVAARIDEACRNLLAAYARPPSDADGDGA